MFENHSCRKHGAKKEVGKGLEFWGGQTWDFIGIPTSSIQRCYKVDRSWMVSYPTNPLLSKINMEWLADPDRDHSHFPHKFWRSYEHLIQYQSENSCTKVASTSIPVETSSWIPLTSGICRNRKSFEIGPTDYEPLNLKVGWLWTWKRWGVFECNFHKPRG